MSFISNAINKAVSFASGGGMLKVIVPQVMNAIEGVTKGQKTIQEMVNAPILDMIKEVTGGMWTGEGANKFVGELNSSYVPNIQGIGEQIGGIAKHISSAVDTIQQADKKAAALIQDLAAEYENIYKG